MQLEHSFTVPVGIDEAWRILLDIERIGPCMPGAKIESVDGDDFTGSVKVKLGPINLTYKGKASFVEKDEAAHRAVIDARGRDARGNGTAAAKVTADLAEADGTTTVTVVTELDITGKPAQFGRGVMVDVGNKLIGQFADCLAATIAGGPAEDEAESPTEAVAPVAAEEKPEPDPTPEAVDEPGPATGPAPEATEAEAAPEPAPATKPDTVAAPRPVTSHRAPEAEPEPIDLLQSAGPAVAKRLAPIAVALVVVLAAVWRRRGRHVDG